MDAKWYLLLLIAGFSALNTRGLSQNIQRRCGLSDYKDPFARNILEQNERSLDAISKKKVLKLRSDLYIPLVFHFVLTEGSDTFTQSEIQYQIEVLNECFNGQNKDLAKVPDIFRSTVSQKPGFLFCLGAKEENGVLKPGIEYRFTESDAIGDAINAEGKPIIKYDQLGGFDGWDPKKYVNIWVGDLSVIQGNTTLPNTAIPEETGIVLDPDYFGVHGPDHPSYPFHLGKTLVHEMAHYFNLLHIWGMETTCESDDGIADTPLQSVIYTGCPTGIRESCGSPDMYMNFMNFTNDACLLFFTNEQKLRIFASIEAFYPDLPSQTNCITYPSGETDLSKVIIHYFPSSHTLKLENIPPSCDKIELLILQADGKLFQAETVQCEVYEEIDLKNLPVGIYILFLQTGNNFLSRKLFVY